MIQPCKWSNYTFEGVTCKSYNNNIFVSRMGVLNLADNAVPDKMSHLVASIQYLHSVVNAFSDGFSLKQVKKVPYDF